MLRIIIAAILFLQRKVERLVVKHYYQKTVEKMAISWAPPLRVNGKSNINNHTSLGRNVHFNGLRIKGEGKVIIGDNFHSGRNINLITEIHNFRSEHSIPYDKVVINKPITIGDNVWLGDRVTILGGVEIGEGAIIQADSVVVSDIPPLAIAGGHPAKVFSERNQERYYRLKKEERFI